MHHPKFALREIPQLAHTDKEYAHANPSLRPFYKYDVSLTEFEKIIQDKSESYQQAHRQVLRDTLLEQYKTIQNANAVVQNIHLLADNQTFTVVTAHQPLLATGALYFIYKTVAVIQLARQLKTHYPQYNFVPLFWLGAEDHDFEEVNHLSIFNKKVIWQDEQGGAVGDYTTDSLQVVLEELQAILGTSANATTLIEYLKNAYQPNQRYSDATRQFLHSFFGNDGLVVLDSNTVALKRLFIPVLEDDLLAHHSHQFVAQTVAQLESLGFKNQAFPREINVFYLSPNSRQRIVQEGDYWTVLNTDIRWTKEELLAELHAYPARFSPNVVLRPLFQEWLLPNLAYIGGGGEIAYWLERKAQFEHFGVNFPMLVRRPSVWWIDAGTVAKLTKMGIQLADLYGDIHTIQKQYISAQSEAEFSLESEKNQLKQLFEQVLNKTKSIDASLDTQVLAQQAQALNALDKLEEKLIRAEKKKHETALLQLQKLKEKYFPNNGLQERSDNFLMYYAQYGNAFLDTLFEQLEPLGQQFQVLIF